MSERPLYNDGQIEIDYHPTSDQDHLLRIVCREGRRSTFPLQRGVLEHLAGTKIEDFVGRLQRLDSRLLNVLDREGIFAETLHHAIVQAYEREQEEIKEFREYL